MCTSPPFGTSTYVETDSICCRSLFCESVLLSTTPRPIGNHQTVGGLIQLHGNHTPPRISPSCPHCLSLWLDSEYRSTVSLRDSLPKLLWAGWVSLGHLSRPSFMRSSPHRWVLAHPPHRCSPSSGGRQPTLFVAGYDCRRQCFSRCRQAVVFGLCSL